MGFWAEIESQMLPWPEYRSPGTIAKPAQSPIKPDLVLKA
jgi:hypothetical protein